MVYDDPLERHKELNADRKLGSEGKPLTDLRLAALEHARKMPTTAEASNWVQLGPTVIPKGQAPRQFQTPAVRAAVHPPAPRDPREQHAGNRPHPG